MNRIVATLHTPRPRRATRALVPLALAGLLLAPLLGQAAPRAAASTPRPVGLVNVRGTALTPLLHGHRAGTHTSLSDTQRQFPTRVLCPTCGQYHLEVSLPQHPGQYGGKEVTTMEARLRDAAAIDAAVLAQKVSAILTIYRRGHLHKLRCGSGCLAH